MTEPPVLCAFLLCDHVWRDSRSGKWSVQGIFQAVLSPRLPIDLSGYGLYAALTNMKGTYLVQVKLLRASDEQELAIVDDVGSMTVDDPARTVEFGIDLGDVALPYHGVYLLRLLANDVRVHDVVLSAPSLGGRE